MLDTLVTFVFYIITSVYNLLFSPFLNLIFSLFPSIGALIGHISSFLDTILTYFSSVLSLMLIPRAALILLFDYFAIKYSVYLVKLTIKLGVKIYNIFKP